MSQLRDTLKSEVVPVLKETFGSRNDLALPRIQKIVASMGVGKASKDAKLLDAAMKDLALITGQKPSVRRASKSVANFGVREGQPVGCVVTMRGRRMYEFLERLIHVAIPRIRDFRGLTLRGFDGRGNYNLGLRDQTVFPEIPYDQVDAVRGLCVTIVVSNSTDEKTELLLRKLGMPFVGA